MMEDIKKKKEIIASYIDAYNAFDIEGMTANMHEAVYFENSSQGTVDLSLRGVVAFKEQAEKAKTIFSQRRQTIEGWKIDGDTVEVQIDYEGILAIDIPGKAQKGDVLIMSGRSEFTFDGNKIIQLKDIS